MEVKLETKQEYEAAAMLLGEPWKYDYTVHCFKRVSGSYKRQGSVYLKYEYIDADTLQRVTEYRAKKRFKERRITSRGKK